MKLLTFVLLRARLFEWVGRLARGLGRALPARWVNGRWHGWGRHRDLPPFPKQSFRELYRRLER
jgi:L-lactate dehydrogenase complex protein LldF